MTGNKLRAGAATVEITPKAGTHLAGNVGGYRPAQSILDPLYARAVVFESNGRMFCFLSIDVTIVTREYTDRIRAAAAARHGFEATAIVVHATQTHSAPSIGHFMVDDDFPPVPADRDFVRGGDLVYAAWAAERAIEAIGAAVARLAPAQIGAGCGALAGLGFNRRAVMRDGKVSMPWFYSSLSTPLGRNDIRYIEGPTDAEVGVLCVRDSSSGATVALLLHHTCHPVNVFASPHAYVSADWPGAWAAEMQAICGPDCVPLVLNGCCGNINPWPAFEPDFFPNHQRMGRALAAMSEQVIATLNFTDETVLDWQVKDVALDVRQDDTELAEAREFLDRHPEPPWQEGDPKRVDSMWNRAAYRWSTELMRRRNPKMNYEIQACRLGDTAFVGLPGEPFVEGQLAIKIASPTYPTFAVHCTTQYVGYLPTRDAYARAGHEVFYCKVAPGSLETVVDEAGGLLRALFA